jgi:hypothetical protein
MPISAYIATMVLHSLTLTSSQRCISLRCTGAHFNKITTPMGNDLYVDAANLVTTGNTCPPPGSTEYDLWAYVAYVRFVPEPPDQPDPNGMRNVLVLCDVLWNEMAAIEGMQPTLYALRTRNSRNYNLEGLQLRAFDLLPMRILLHEVCAEARDGCVTEEELG